MSSRFDSNLSWRKGLCLPIVSLYSFSKKIDLLYDIAIIIFIKNTPLNIFFLTYFSKCQSQSSKAFFTVFVQILLSFTHFAVNTFI